MEMLRLLLSELNDMLARNPVSTGSMSLEDERMILKMAFNHFAKAMDDGKIPDIPAFYLTSDSSGFVKVEIGL